VDLRRWIVAEHGATLERFDQTIAATIPVERWPEQAGGAGASIAWLLFHVAYHEDLAVSTVLTGRPPLLAHRRDLLGLGAHEPHDGLGEHEDRSVTEDLDLAELSRYARDVHGATSAWLAEPDVGSLDHDAGGPDRLGPIAGVTEDAVPWLYRLWTAKPAAWFVQWEAIGHVQGHLGEMVSVRGRLGLSPF
jgi:hypothetical protein